MLLSHGTKLAYVLPGSDPTEKYFPKDSNIVVLYKNSDEAAAAKLADQYAGNSDVKDVQSYSTTLGKKFTADEPSEKFDTSENSNNLKMGPSMLKLIYYDDASPVHEFRHQ